MNRRWLALGLSLCCLSQPVAAQDLISRQAVLAVNPVMHGEQVHQACTDAMYQVILSSRAYQLLPDWHLSQQVALTSDWQDNWPAFFQQLPEAELALFSRIQQQAQEQELVSVLVAQRNPPEIVKAVVQPLSLRQTEAGCENMARQILGVQAEERFRSPALSATLSLLIPGAGHFYQGTTEGALLGIVFLGSYLTFAWLGFSQSTEPEITRSQWGGLLILLTLLDVISAYFFANGD